MSAEPRTLIVMLKVPRPGRVKTRLAREVGSVAAAAWFRRESLALLRRLRDPRWRLVLAVTPDAEGLASRTWPSDLPRIGQGRGDLGARMGRALAAAPPGPALLVGADLPLLRADHIARAFAALGRAELVFGPAEDGGFWGVGARRRPLPAGIFEGVRWSTDHALADALASVPGRRVALADTLADVDSAADLERLGLPRA